MMNPACSRGETMRHIRINRWTVVGGLFFVFLAITFGIVMAQGGNISYGQTVKGSVKAGAVETWHFIANACDVANIAIHSASGHIETNLHIIDTTPIRLDLYNTA